MSWMNFNNADEQNSSDLIPHKTPVKVVMKIRAGRYDDPSQGWTGGYATRNDTTGAVYLDCEFTIIGGKFNKRKVWSLVGLYSPNGPKWGDMGRAFIRAALESARGVAPNDATERGMKARMINGLGDLDGLEFAAFVEVQKPSAKDAANGYTNDKNVIQTVIPCTHRDYAALMSGEGVSTTPTQSASASHLGAVSQPASASLPAWAQ